MTVNKNIVAKAVVIVLPTTRINLVRKVRVIVDRQVEGKKHAVAN